MVAEIRDTTRVTGKGVGGHNQSNSEGQHHSNGARFGGRRGGHSSGRDGNNGGGAGARGGHGSNTTTPTKTGKKLGAVVRAVGKEVGRRRKNNGLGDGEKIFVRPCHQGAHIEAMSLALTVYS